ncbi:MAG: PcfJ domain-containing protein [Desulfobacterales bacterium]|nr:PcfJ domain-containing protein [Desulfobacterales bacterium]
MFWENSFVNSYGELHIDFRPQLDVFLKILPWEKGLCMFRHKNNNWQYEPFDLGLRLIDQDISLDLAVLKFLNCIPKKIQELVSSYSYLQTTLLQYMAKTDSAIELMETVPILLWIIAYIANTEYWEYEQLENFFSKKRKKILKIALGKEYSSTIKFLKKIHLIDGDEAELKIINTALSNQALIQSLRHYPAIPVSILSILIKQPFWLNSKIIHHILTLPDDDKNFKLSELNQAACLCYDAINIGQALGIQNSFQILNQLKGLNEIKRLHDRWSNRLNNINKQRLKDKYASELERMKVLFPEPPILGNEFIQPIICEESLFIEGIEMKHCVGSYTNKILNGESYIYKVLAPQRATLEIEYIQSKWRIAQLKLAKNQSPSLETHNAVLQWLLKGQNVSKLFGDNSLYVNPSVTIISNEISNTTELFKITIIGVGGAGGNAINYMVDHNIDQNVTHLRIKCINFLAIDTDIKALQFSKTLNRIQIGSNLI